VTAGEWDSPRVFLNSGGDFVDKTYEFGLSDLTGWWQSIHTLDIDLDGDKDIICGNVGRNTTYSVSDSTPVHLYLPDLNNDGTVEPIMTYFQGGRETLQTSRDLLFRRQPFLFRKFPKHQDFAEAGVPELFPPDDFPDMKVLNSRSFESVLIRNEGRNKLKAENLPVELQLIPVRGVEKLAVSSDRVELIVFGNGNTMEFDGESLGGSAVMLLVVDIHSGKYEVEYLTELMTHEISDLSILTLSTSEQIIAVASRSGPIRFYRKKNRSL
jgi:hypothetical protein